jgi:putative aldouronate transport system permease protein
VRNTLVLNGLNLVFGFTLPIIFAVLVNEVKNMKFKKTVQTASYLPYFISTVVVVGMMTNFLSPSSGIVNQLIVRLGGKPINFMSDPRWFRRLYVISGSWQTFGFNSIIFVAAIMGIDPALYEAMNMDGASRWQQIIHLVLPMISETIILLLIMTLGNLLNVGFEKVYLMYSPAVYETGDVISTYVYRQGIENHNYGYASAVGLFYSAVGFVFVVASNWLSRRMTGSSLW